MEHNTVKVYEAKVVKTETRRRTSGIFGDAAVGGCFYVGQTVWCYQVRNGSDTWRVSRDLGRNWHLTDLADCKAHLCTVRVNDQLKVVKTY